MHGIIFNLFRTASRDAGSCSPQLQAEEGIISRSLKIRKMPLSKGRPGAEGAIYDGKR